MEGNRASETGGHEFKNRDEVLRAVAERIEALGTPVVVGIGGHGGSGKSSFTRLLVEQVPGSQEIGLDFFYYPLAQRDTTEALRTYNFDVHRFKEEVLDRFLNGDRGFPYRIYNWAQDELDGLINDWSRVREDTEVLVVEGGVNFHPLLVDSYDLRIWFECDYEERLARGVERDMAYNMPGQTRDSVTKRWLEEYHPLYERYITEYKPKDSAEIVIDTTNETYRIVREHIP